uniref:cysteine desulfurase n=1 Tax=Oryzias sinensis TaxID=183150 RepID=A0A8C8DKK5_9TELE
MLSPGRSASCRLLRPASWLSFRRSSERLAAGFPQRELIKKHELGKDELRPLYMDFQATTPMDPRVLDAMLPYQVNYYGNPHSRTHAYGWESETAMENARQQVADLIGADPREIVFTSGATESNNMAIKGVARFYQAKKRHVITTQTEHKCVLDSCRVLEAEGFSITYLPVQKNGLLDLEMLKACIRPDTCLVSMMTINNEIGVKQPIKDIGQICRSKGVFFHTDAAQAVGKIPVDVNDWKVDLMSISGHKIYGPKGVGALYVRRRPRVRLEPLQNGGGQERGLRSGTVPTPLAVGLGAACSIARAEMEVKERKERRRNGLIAGLSLTPPVRWSSSDAVSRVCRFGIGRFTTEEEVDYTADKCIQQVRRLREMSPLWEMVQEGVDLKSIKWTQH